MIFRFLRVYVQKGGYLLKFKLGKHPGYIKDKELLADLKRVAELTGKKSITKTDYYQYGIYCKTTYLSHFGSWNRAVILAGLKPSRRSSLNKLELLLNLKKVWLALGRRPLQKEMNSPVSEFCTSAYISVFGSFWNALRELVEVSNRQRKRKVKSPFIDIDRAKNKNRTKREVNDSLRYRVLFRDNFRCVKCGSSPANQRGVLLQVDHIKPYSKGGETVIKNLQTLCRRCNNGKSNNYSR
jgi:5-methylcytosine-specific restriction endonuclease McrA